MSGVLKLCSMYMYQCLPPMKTRDEQLLLSIMRDASTIGNPHASEVYSPSMATSLAKRCGIRARRALDLTTIDDDNEQWDFINPHKKKNSANELAKEQTSLF